MPKIAVVGAGYWGPNLSVAAVLTRQDATAGATEVLLGGLEEKVSLALPKGFVLHEEDALAAVGRVLEREVGWRPPPDHGEEVFEGFTYDRRQTDHAWVERRGYLFDPAGEEAPDLFDPRGDLEDVSWWPLTADTMMRVPAGHAPFVHEALEAGRRAGWLDEDLAERLIQRAV